jgi:hypothetical protein
LGGEVEELKKLPYLIMLSIFSPKILPMGQTPARESNSVLNFEGVSIGRQNFQKY